MPVVKQEWQGWSQASQALALCPSCSSTVQVKLPGLIQLSSVIFDRLFKHLRGRAHWAFTPADNVTLSKLFQLTVGLINHALDPVLKQLNDDWYRICKCLVTHTQEMPITVPYTKSSHCGQWAYRITDQTTGAFLRFPKILFSERYIWTWTEPRNMCFNTGNVLF